MIKNNRFNISRKIKFAALSLALLVLLISFGQAVKKDNYSGADPEKIDPLDEKAGDFLEADFEKILMQADKFVREKKYLHAAQYYLALLRFHINDFTTIYNLACCYGQLERADLAVKYLVRAVNAGFRDFGLLKGDKDFDKIRHNSEFMRLMSMLPAWEEERGEIIYAKTSKLVPLLIKLPQKFEPTQKYPLLIGLHGNGGNPEQMLSGMNKVLKNEPVILAAPQGAYPNLSQLSGQHFSWEIQTRQRELWKIGDPLSVENLAEVGQVIRKKYPISEVYILGFSQGAAYALLYGFKYPQLVTGIISIGGVFPETDTEFSILKAKEIEDGKKIRVFIAQGSNDRLIPPGLGPKTTEKLKKYGYKVEYQEYEGGHEITPALLKKIYSWMAEK